MNTLPIDVQRCTGVRPYDGTKCQLRESCARYMAWFVWDEKAGVRQRMRSVTDMPCTGVCVRCILVGTVA